MSWVWTFGQCLCACSYIWSPVFTDEDEPKHLFIAKIKALQKCNVLQLTLCVWYRCRSDRRQRKCSRANGVHSLQRILPGDQKRKIEKNKFTLAFSFRNTTCFVCSMRQETEIISYWQDALKALVARSALSKHPNFWMVVNTSQKHFWKRDLVRVDLI